MAPYPSHTNLWEQFAWLVLLSLPIACIARTVVYEEVFREPRDWCKSKSENCRQILQRKFFYLFTCEYCFSHWVTLGFLIMTNYRLLLPDWRGSVIAFFALVIVANLYLNIYARLKVDITREKVEIEAIEKKSNEEEQVSTATTPPPT